MSDKIVYYYSHMSPWTYLGHDRLMKLAADKGLEIDYVPLTLAKVFPVSGGLPLPKRPIQRQAYRMSELHRWPDYLGIPLNPEPAHFPGNDAPAAKMALIAQAEGHDIGKLSGAYLRAVWVEERDINDEATLISIANENGFDGADLLEKSKSEEVEKMLDAACQRCNYAQAFGSPWYEYKGEGFWGQDRLDMLAYIIDKK